MAMFTCSACGATKTKGYVRKCDACSRILCDSCKGPHSACRESKQNKSDCNGMFLRPYVPQMQGA